MGPTPGYRPSAQGQPRFRWAIGLILMAPLMGCASDPVVQPTADPTDPPLPPATVQAPDSWESTGGGFTFESGWAFLDATKTYYQTHPDEVDFIFLYTDQRVEGLWQFAVTIRPDIQGIGQQEVYAGYGWDGLPLLDMAGSAGRLQHVVLMNDRTLWDSAAYTSQSILAHEVAHRWGAYMSIPGDAPTALLDASRSHWADVAHVGGPSALGYGDLLDNGDGSYTHQTVRPLQYSRLELYQMGLIPPSEVGPLFYLRDPTSQGAPYPADAYGSDVTLNGERVDLSIDDLIAINGPRVPAHGAAPTEFEAAFVLVCDGPCSPEGLAFVAQEREAWSATFARATGGLAQMDVR